MNQKQTNRYEIAGVFRWSPKANCNGARNSFYETMRKVAPGDLFCRTSMIRDPGDRLGTLAWLHRFEAR